MRYPKFVVGRNVYGDDVEKVARTVQAQYDKVLVVVRSEAPDVYNNNLLDEIRIATLQQFPPPKHNDASAKPSQRLGEKQQ